MPEITDAQLAEFQKSMVENGDLKVKLKDSEAKISSMSQDIEKVSGKINAYEASVTKLKEDNNALAVGLKKNIVMSDVSQMISDVKARTGKTLHNSFINQRVDKLMAVDVAKRGTEEYKIELSKVLEEAYEEQVTVTNEILGSQTSDVNVLLNSVNGNTHASSGGGISIPTNFGNPGTEQESLLSGIGISSILPSPSPNRPGSNNQNVAQAKGFMG